jgi:hypothetical protein
VRAYDCDRPSRTWGPVFICFGISRQNADWTAAEACFEWTVIVFLGWFFAGFISDIRKRDTVA